MVDPLRNFTLKIILTWLMKTSQNMSMQQLRLFIWYKVSDHVAIEGLVASNDNTLTEMKSLMQQQTRMTWNARLFTWWKCVSMLKIYWISS